MTIRLFVGCAANGEDAESQAVLEHSVRKHTKADVQITWMRLSNEPSDPFFSDVPAKRGWQTTHWATPFSGFRWAIPELCQFSGKAIYADSDVIFMADIRELWEQEFEPGKVVMAKGQKASWRYCVSMWDCAEAKRHLMPLSQLRADPMSHSKMGSYFALMSKTIVQPFKGEWNCLDGEDYESLHDPRIKAIHYTSMSHQPQLKYAIPRLEAEGRSHWYDGRPRQHWRADLIELFDELLMESHHHPWNVGRFIQQPRFGRYHKKAVGGQSDQLPSWGKTYMQKHGLSAG